MAVANNHSEINRKTTSVQATLSAEDYLSLPVNELLRRLDTSTAGLNSQQA